MSVDTGLSSFGQGLWGGIDYLENKIGTGTSLGKTLREGERAYIQPTRDELAKIPHGSAKSIVSGGIEGLLPLFLT
jgi:hypothetical protein